MMLPQPAGRPAVHDDPRYLYQVIQTIASEPDLDAILRGVVRLTTEATACHGGFVYFLQDRELVLRAASRLYTRAEGRVRISIDEGLVGWAARTRRSASIADRALDDPRVVHVPELEGEHFQSMMAVPILSRTGSTIGVIGMHAQAPRHFQRSVVDFVEHVALLLADAIDRVRLTEEAEAHAGLLAGLDALARRVAAAASLEELCADVVAGCRELLAAARCELHLLVTGPGSAGRAPVELVAEDAGGVALVAPLVSGAEQLGQLCAVVPVASPERRSVLAVVASCTAVALERMRLAEASPLVSLPRRLFEELAREGGAADEALRAIARRLPCDLAAPHLVLHAVPWTVPAGLSGHPSAWRESAHRLQSVLSRELTGSVFDRHDGSLRALLRVPIAGPQTAVEIVRRVHAEVASGPAGPLAVGLSGVGEGAPAHARGLGEAESAAQVGPLLAGGAGVFTFEQLGAYRYALGAERTIRDHHQVRIERLLDHDRLRGSDLVRTLDSYLELRGSIAQTARRLSLHPNTLRQRLARIERLTGLTLESDDWLSLAMAIKAVELRTLRARLDGD
jgi:putative methionine-R-sulfoxide reductase with GAF domain